MTPDIPQQRRPGEADESDEGFGPNQIGYRPTPRGGTPHDGQENQSTELSSVDWGS